jgi:hypothetical protein
MEKRYLVIWQLGNNEQSKHETPLDVIVNDVNTAEEIYDRIKNAIIKTYGKGYSDKMNILGVYTL